MTADINAAKERLTKLADDTGAHYGSDRLGWLVGGLHVAEQQFAGALGTLERIVAMREKFGVDQYSQTQAFELAHRVASDVVRALSPSKEADRADHA